MILTHIDNHGGRRMVDINDLFEGRTAMLVGGAPSLREQPMHLLERRGMLTMSMNNAAVHFRPVMWSSGDDPRCYEPQILADPSIMKFAPIIHADAPLEWAPGKRYHMAPNIYFYKQETGVAWDEFLASRPGIPWYNNTLFVSIHLLYQLGIRRIILAGSDFGFSATGDMYAHKTELGSLERRWNMELYNFQVRELRLLKPMFERHGLQLMDCSKNSRLRQTYEWVDFETAAALCLGEFPQEPVNPATLPHCSKFAPQSLKDSIAGLPQNKPPPDAAPGAEADQDDNYDLHQVLL